AEGDVVDRGAVAGERRAVPQQAREPIEPVDIHHSDGNLGAAGGEGLAVRAERQGADGRAAARARPSVVGGGTAVSAGERIHIPQGNLKAAAVSVAFAVWLNPAAGGERLAIGAEGQAGVEAAVSFRPHVTLPRRAEGVK